MTRNEILDSLLSEIRHSEFIEAEECVVSHFDIEILNNPNLQKFVSDGIAYAVSQLEINPSCGPRMTALIGHELVMLGYRLAKAEMEIEKLEVVK